MKYLPLVWAGLWRKRTRTILTFLSIATAFVLLGVLQGINQGMSAAVKRMHLDRLYVMNRVNATWPQPVTITKDIRKIPGVRHVGHWTYFAGFFREPRNMVGGMAVDAAEMFALYPELNVPADQVAAMLQRPMGIIIGRPLAERYGWKIGDHVPLGSLIWRQKSGASTWEFDIVGIFDLKGRSTLDPNNFFVNFDYFDEARGGFGIVHMIVVGIADPRMAERISAQIDRTFMTSGSQTRTRNEQAYARTQMKQIGNVGLIANTVCGAALFTLLFVTGNAMTQSVRERTAEFAVLKTLGFSDRQVLVVVLSEALALCVVAALVGLAISRAIYPRVAAIFGPLQMPMTVLFTGIGMAVLVAALSALAPAMRAVRLNVVDALAGR